MSWPAAGGVSAAGSRVAPVWGIVDRGYRGGDVRLGGQLGAEFLVGESPLSFGVAVRAYLGVAWWERDPTVPSYFVLFQPGVQLFVTASINAAGRP